MEGLRLFFDHIPKTAGTSLQQFFVDAFGEERVTPVLRGYKYRHALSVYAAYRVITGHFYFIPGDELPKGYILATILRDPRERTLSEYFFIVNDVPNSGCGPLERRIKTMSSCEEALWDPDFSKRVWNFQAIHFASFFHPQPSTLKGSELLDLAKKGLEQYHMVGTTERLNEFVEALKGVFNISEDVMLKRYNQTSRRMMFDELPGRVQDRIKELTEVDIELWRYAGMLFDSHTRRFSPADFVQRSACLCPPAPDIDTSAASSDTASSSISCQTEQVAPIMEDGSLELIGVGIQGQMRPYPAFMPGESAVLRISFRALRDIDDLTIGYSIHHDSGLHLFGMNTRLLGKRFSVRAGGEYYVDFVFSMNLGLGRYFINVSAHAGTTHLERCYLWREKVAYFDVDGFDNILFEGLVRLMPSVFPGVLSSDGRLDSEQVFVDGINKIGLNTPSISDCKGFIRCVKRPEFLEIRPGEQISVFVEIMNQGNANWILEGNRPVNISYHWLNGAGEPLIFDGFRTPLPCNEIPAGRLVSATAMVEAPKEQGEFILELTLVQEGVTWFEERGFATERVAVMVK